MMFENSYIIMDLQGNARSHNSIIDNLSVIVLWSCPVSSFAMMHINRHSGEVLLVKELIL